MGLVDCSPAITVPVTRISVLVRLVALVDCRLNCDHSWDHGGVPGAHGTHSDKGL